MIKADEKTFDLVHDTQEIYRNILDCMARPGKINSIEKSTAGIEEVSGISQALLGLAYTLVDREVSFHVISTNDKTIEKHIHRKTYSLSSSRNDVDYLFIEQALSKEEIENVMGQVRFGTLEDPHLSTTILFTVDGLSKTNETGKKLKLKGPGIESQETIFISGLPPEWLFEREKVNKEYPLGVDMIMVTKSGDVVAFPRTTIIESECV
jgi:alpha-D-ribose 1-methylphosphonate 5-triphosphate synthase subunit PhnH